MILLLLIASIANAGFCEFYDFCIQDGNIFERWGNYLRANDHKKWFKPLGLCVYCFNGWFSIFTFPVVGWLMGVSLIWWLPLLCVYIGLSHYALTLIHER